MARASVQMRCSERHRSGRSKVPESLGAQTIAPDDRLALGSTQPEALRVTERQVSRDGSSTPGAIEIRAKLNGRARSRLRRPPDSTCSARGHSSPAEIQLTGMAHSDCHAPEAGRDPHMGREASGVIPDHLGSTSANPFNAVSAHGSGAWQRSARAARANASPRDA